MEIVRKTDTVTQTVVALGNFDGLHKAHMQVIKTCICEARKRGVKSAVLLFFEHPQNIINHRDISLITDSESKMEILKSAGLDTVFIRHFDEEFMGLSPEEFVDLLVREMSPVAICVGYDYRFGHKAMGDIKTLKAICQGKSIDVFVTDEIKEDGVAVKSTAIRQYIKDGEIEKANAMLGRCFTMRGEVVYGRQNGRTIGFPTANLDVKKNVVLPSDGVYMGYTTVDGLRYKSLINVGNNPTVCGEKTTVESHIIDFSGDIYGKVIEVEFCRRLRGEIKFQSLDSLKEQIQKDLERVIQCT